MVPGFMRQDTCRYSVEVPIIRLDEYLRDQEVNQIRVIKIDAEGYEFPVLKGLSDFFENAKSLPIIICEIAPAAYPLLGYTLQDLGNYLRGFNYYAYNLSAKSGIDITKLDRTTNVLFLNN